MSNQVWASDSSKLGFQAGPVRYGISNNITVFQANFSQTIPWDITMGFNENFIKEGETIRILKDGIYHVRLSVSYKQIIDEVFRFEHHIQITRPGIDTIKYGKTRGVAGSPLDLNLISTYTTNATVMLEKGSTIEAVVSNNNSLPADYILDKHETELEVLKLV
jgi:hypothetical protein